MNLIPNAPVVFDNLLTERILPDINVRVMLEENESLSDDTKNVCGTVSLSTYIAAEGDSVKLTAIEKAGYRLKEYRAEDSVVGIMVTNNTFTVPAGITEDLCIVAVFEPVSLQDGRDYYIDSDAGDDAGEGTLDAPWKTFAPLKEAGFTLSPGSHIYLKRGSVFVGQDFRFKGMGTKEKPIVVDAYGEGELPRLDGNGVVENVISLSNQEYIEIRNLEITNTHPDYNHDFGLNTSDNKEKVLRAISVSAKNFGTVSGIRIQDCYIHDINGHLGNKLNGGIYVQIGADKSNGRLIGVPTKFDDMLIEGCTFLRVDRSGIKAVISDWCTQYYEDAPAPINWYPSTNVVIRNNYLEKIGGDGITVRDTDGALVEYNRVKDSRYQNTGYNVAIWPFQAANTVIQYNEVSDTHGTQDGQGLDCDYASSNTLIQYNYSHNNEGGFMLIMGIYPHIGATVRYNVSQNDRDKAFEFARGVPKGTMIYNNTLYSQNKVDNGILYLSNTAGKDSLGVSDMYLFNNLFCYPEGQTFYGGADSNQLPGISKLHNNGYVGGISAPAEEDNAIMAANVESVLKAAGTAPENESKIARTGFSEELSGYRLVENSPMIDAGITMEEAIEYFGNGKADIKDSRRVSPRDLYEQAKIQSSEKSINYIMGENFPEVTGVDYRLDFFGNSNLNGTKPDIGAAETVQHTHLEKKVQVITATDAAKKFGDAPFKLNASANGGGALSYVSRNLSVARIDESGLVTITGAGKTEIEIYAAETEGYLAAKKTVTIKVVPQKAKIKSVSNKKSGKLVVSWNKQNEADGYVVEYSANKKFAKGVKQVIIKKNTAKTTIKKLKKGKKYFVRVKAYKMIDGQKIYGDVSRSKAKKVK